MPATPRRGGPGTAIASLIPATTELLFAIGAGDAVVGRTTWCDYPPRRAAVRQPRRRHQPQPRGDPRHPSGPGHPVQLDAERGSRGPASAAGVPALRLNTDALPTSAGWRDCSGRASGHERGADSVRGRVRHGARVGDERVRPHAPKVLLLVWEQPPMTIGRGSFLASWWNEQAAATCSTMSRRRRER